MLQGDEKVDGDVDDDDDDNDVVYMFPTPL